MRTQIRLIKQAILEINVFRTWFEIKELSERMLLQKCVLNNWDNIDQNKENVKQQDFAQERISTFR